MMCAGLSHNSAEENRDYQFGNIWDRKTSFRNHISIVRLIYTLQLEKPVESNNASLCSFRNVLALIAFI